MHRQEAIQLKAYYIPITQVVNDNIVIHVSNMKQAWKTWIRSECSSGVPTTSQFHSA